MMRLMDLFLFGPPLLIGVGGWLAVWLLNRSLARDKALDQSHGAAE